ncbi:hypothetical protein UFOVP1451_37 [uncultured Caudovirales phage]|uniref:Uncharacterized protein n=1 Tax=uncultured Caudovirales phage TaxID=2100421 RepID=A0A6J5SIA6_9CAUD|nr:hypothetical protein UFOVP1451_37 [uncultured Caudovirales phage]
MGKGNPLSGAISGATSVVRGSGRTVRDNPLNVVGLPFNAVNTETQREEQKTKGAVAAGQASTAQATADRLNAEESVRAQKEKARKQTIFGGSAQTNLFNKSLIGASTTAAAGTGKSILGA